MNLTFDEYQTVLSALRTCQLLFPNNNPLQEAVHTEIDEAIKILVGIEKGSHAT